MSVETMEIRRRPSGYYIARVGADWEIFRNIVEAAEWAEERMEALRMVRETGG